MNMAEEKPQVRESIYDRIRREAAQKHEQERQRRARLDELKARRDLEWAQRLGGNDR
jgi:hypothetical protein